MKTIKLYLSDVNSDPLGANAVNDGTIAKIIRRLATRAPGGAYSNELRDAAYLKRKLASAESRAYFKYSLIKFFLGDSFAKRRTPDHKEREASLYGAAQEKRIEYRKRSRLYHFTSVANLDGIMKCGLVAKREYLVFLSDDRNMSGFLRWKTLGENKNMEFCVLKIDAKRLRKKHKLYYYKKNEIVTEYVEPEFITGTVALSEERKSATKKQNENVNNP